MIFAAGPVIIDFVLICVDGSEMVDFLLNAVMVLNLW